MAIRYTEAFCRDAVRIALRSSLTRPKIAQIGIFASWARSRKTDKGYLTLDDLVRDLLEDHGLKVARSSVGYWLHRLGLIHKNNAAK